MPSYPIQSNPGAFVPTTDIFDSQQIHDLDVNSDEFKEFLVRLRQSINDIALVLNIKDTGYYDTQEMVNGQAYFANPTFTAATAIAPTLRQVFRTVVDCGALLNTAALSVKHKLNINEGYSFTRIYGCATDRSSSFIPLPFSSPTLAENIKLEVDETDVIITTGNDRTPYTDTYVVLEFLKS